MSTAPLTGIARFGEPGRISPLIKFARYACLSAGIFYGYSRNKFLQNRADKFKEVRDKRVAERLERERLAKIQSGIDAIKELEKLTGAKIA